MPRLARRFVDAESGQSLVEFAVGALLYFTVLFGTIELGLLVWRYNTVANLAQEGARWASVRGSTSTIADKDVQKYVRDRAVGLTVTVTTTPPLDAPSPPQPGQTVSVQVQTAVAPLTSLVPHGTLTVSSTATMVIAR
jgi:Flp pilus assembly protein TadG